MAERFHDPRAQFLDADGAPLSGGLLAFYESGTATPKDTYSDDGLTVANSNPVVLDSAGRLPHDVFLAGDLDYKAVLKTAAGVTVWTADPVSGAGGSGATTAVTESRNAIVNPEFTVNTRGVATYTAATSPANNDATELLDEWTLLSDGNDIVDVSQETTIRPTGSYACLKAVVQTASKKFGFVQYIDARDTAPYVGQAISVSFKARTTSGKVINSLRAGVLAWTGTADAYTVDVVSAWGIQGTNPTLVGSWQFVNTPANLALTPDAFGTYALENIPVEVSGAKNLALLIWVDDTDAAINDELYLGQVYWRLGASAGTIERRPDALERLIAYQGVDIAGLTAVTALADDDLLLVYDASAGGNRKVTRANLTGLPRGYLVGFGLSNNATDATNDIDIAAGECRDSTDTVDIVLASGMTKRLDATFAAGSGNGGLDTGSIANTTYHVHAILNPSSGAVDVLFSTSASAPTLPAGYTKSRRIGSFIRAAGAILPFLQRGDWSFFKDPRQDVSGSNPGTSAVTRTLSVPTGIKVLAKMAIRLSVGTTGTRMYLSDLDATDAVPSDTYLTLAALNVTNLAETGQAEVWTDTAAGIRSRFSFSDASTSLSISTLGWVDRRGRDD